MKRWWLLLIAAAVALGWWSINYWWPQQAWNLGQYADAAILGLLAALVADRVIGEAE